MSSILRRSRWMTSAKGTSNSPSTSRTKTTNGLKRKFRTEHMLTENQTTIVWKTRIGTLTSILRSSLTIIITGISKGRTIHQDHKSKTMDLIKRTTAVSWSMRNTRSPKSWTSVNLAMSLLLLRSSKKKRSKTCSSREWERAMLTLVSHKPHSIRRMLQERRTTSLSTIRQFWSSIHRGIEGIPFRHKTNITFRRWIWSCIRRVRRQMQVRWMPIRVIQGMASTNRRMRSTKVETQLRKPMKTLDLRDLPHFHSRCRTLLSSETKEMKSSMAVVAVANPEVTWVSSARKELMRTHRPRQGIIL